MGIKAFLLWVLIFTSLIFGLIYKSSSSVCEEIYRKDANIQAGRMLIYAQTATTTEEQERGLSGRECIGSNQGMLFVFNKPDYYEFWMKDMKFPIDIIWLDENKKVVHVIHDVSPDTFPVSYSSEKTSKYVLELKSGEAKRLNLRTETTLRF